MSPNTNIKNSPMVFIGIIIAGLIIGGAIIYKDKNISGPQRASLTEAGTSDENGASFRNKVLAAGDKGEHVKGNPEAPVTIIEFSDFECPYCARFNQTMNQVMINYPNEVKWVYRHFPLGSHLDAQPAAEAAECASEQGKFWEFHDGLYENQSELGNNLYQKLAKKLGLDTELFQKCLTARKYKDRVDADQQVGVSLDIQGTPGNFINGEPIGGALPYDQIKIIIDLILSEK